MAQAIEWWERAGEDALASGVDPQLALRMFAKAEAAAATLAAQRGGPQPAADSVMNLRGRGSKATPGSTASFHSQLCASSL